MCYWGCIENNMMYKCKYCGTRYCKACKKGAFYGEMITENTCRICNQPRCQGERIVIQSLKKPQDDKNEKNSKKKSTTTGGKRLQKTTKKRK
ncbi:uncharacterized protein LOC116294693 [Actinia tenebrosa]|uniref:Uncharacterized protein LOC116294693 n=1 Tax=Actinia tenebrosa TaxID=6105 RepID=A0A6P8HP88_ACTTE|nr:uncharacterized protein LOC116294693 [Actinia tenebrosa]